MVVRRIKPWKRRVGLKLAVFSYRNLIPSHSSLIPHDFLSFFHFLTAIMNLGMAIMRPMREGCR